MNYHFPENLVYWKHHGIGRALGITDDTVQNLCRAVRLKLPQIERTVWLPKTQLSDFFLRLTRTENCYALVDILRSVGYYRGDRIRRFFKDKFYRQEEINRLKQDAKLKATFRTTQRRTGGRARSSLAQLLPRTKTASLSRKRMQKLISRLSRLKKKGSIHF